MEQHPPNQALAVYSMSSIYGGDVYCIARLGNGMLLAGTYKGLFESTNKGESWEFITDNSKGHRNESISALTTIDNAVFATFAGSLYRSTDGGHNWTLTNQPVQRLSIRSLTSLGQSLFAVVGIGLEVDTNSGVYRSDDFGQTWQLITGGLREMPEFKGAYMITGICALTMDGEQFTIVATNHGLYRQTLSGWKHLNSPIGSDVGLLNAGSNGVLMLAGLSRADANQIYISMDQGNNWQSLNGPPRRNRIYGLIYIDDSLFCCTDTGVFVWENGRWKDANKGLSLKSVMGFATVADKLFVAVVEDPHNRFTRPMWEVYRSDDDGETWQPASAGLPTNSEGETFFSDGEDEIDLPLANLGHTIFLALKDGIYRSDDWGSSWYSAAKLPVEPGETTESVEAVVANDDTLIVRAKVARKTGDESSTLLHRLYRSADQGRRWSVVSSISEDAEAVIAPIGDSFFAITNDATSRLPRNGTAWEIVADVPQGKILTSTSTGSKLYAGGKNAGFFVLDTTSQRPSWQRLAADKLQGETRAIWIDSSYPNVMIVGTSQGLFWTDSGGAEFTKLSDEAIREIELIAGTTQGTMIGSDVGLFYVYDQIPRGRWYQRVYIWIKDHATLVITSLLTSLVLLVLSTRLILMLMQLEVWPITIVAPWFYLTPLGRWKLFRRYRQALANEKETRETALTFVDLPYDCDVFGEELTTLKLSDNAFMLLASYRILVIAEGGRGKSALCRNILLRSLRRETQKGYKRREPVLVEGVNYNGDLLDTITNALMKRSAYVNPTIVKTQLAAGNLLILFDGFSEIHEAAYEKSYTTDISTFIQRNVDVPYVFTSRSPLPIAILNALGDTAKFSLKDVDEGTERVFLTQYLSRRKTTSEHTSQKVDDLIQQINLRFPALPRIPLMLKLIATIYDKTGRVPKDRLTLFSDYVEQLLRSDVTGISDSIGLKFAIRHLVRHTYLKSGGDRGVGIIKAVQITEEINERLKSFDINISPIGLLNLLTRAGLYKRTGDNVRFFHDSFESYFAAQAMEEDFRNGNRETLKSAAGNKRIEEAWDFLTAMLEETGEVEQLEQFTRLA